MTLKENHTEYFDDTGHLTTEGRAYYVEAAKNDELETLPPSVKNHVTDCIKCLVEVEGLYQISKENQPHRQGVPSANRSFSIKPFYKLVASFLLVAVCIASLIAIKQHYSHQSIFNRHFEEYKGSYNRDNGTNSQPQGPFEDGIQKYMDRNYAGAAQTWRKINKKNLQTHFYLAQSYLNTAQYDSAIAHLELALDNFKLYGTYEEEIKWGLAIAHYKKGNIPVCKKYLKEMAKSETADVYYRKKATDLLDDIDSFWYRFF